MSEPALPVDPAVPAVAPVPWRRLDPRMLLVHPVQEVIRFLPFVIGVFVLGNAGGRSWWQLAGVVVPVVFGVVRFLTTYYRITPTQVELQRGLVWRKVLTARLDRVRAIEVTSSPIHRILGLAKVEIGTASGGRQDEDRFALDGLSISLAREMRAALLHRTQQAEAPVAPETGPETGPGTGAGAGPATGRWTGPGDLPPVDAPTSPPAEDVVLVRLDPRWVRYAPLTSSGNVIAAGLLALVGQFLERAELRILRPERVEDLLTGTSVLVVALGLVLSFVVLGAVFAVLGYLVSNWGFTLARDVRGRSLQVRRGLLTSTETSLERDRVRGVQVAEPLGLRLVGAARLSAIVTGLSRSERSTLLVPPAPRAVVDGVGGQTVEDDAPLLVALRRHGPAARRRRYVRALLGASVLPGLVLVICLLTPLSWWLLLVALLPVPFAVLLAADRYRQLGHALTAEHLVVRSGSLRGRRDVVQRSGIIGWNLQQSWFQRRAGLVTLVATTAAGQQAYAAVDVPEPVAVALAATAVPGLVSEFVG